jgi:hypothetical protein
VSSQKMTAVLERLRFDWMRKRGDFTRPRELSREAWRAMDADERVAYEMKRVRVSA